MRCCMTFSSSTADDDAKECTEHNSNSPRVLILMIADIGTINVGTRHILHLLCSSEVQLAELISFHRLIAALDWLLHHQSHVEFGVE